VRTTKSNLIRLHVSTNTREREQKCCKREQKCCKSLKNQD